MMRYKIKLFGIHTSKKTLSQSDAYYIFLELCHLFGEENVELIEVLIDD